jgi:hypothetical protein
VDMSIVYASVSNICRRKLSATLKVRHAASVERTFIVKRKIVSFSIDDEYN